ncbi:hypothetical protein Dsin_004349 [Dipteronia sinensis]|uniref:Endonuclease/exonuclease/phosphatase n=1 Tax=Dipteronia sinensis TaxID=43782 RepID=A0AAE0B9F5_9ROSI|nr:hypothetical protein Dsin_004349 [Dipteronia sinensis]
MVPLSRSLLLFRLVGKRSKVGKDSVSLLVSFSLPIVSSVVSVNDLDDRAGTVSPSVERVDWVILRNGSGSSCSRVVGDFNVVLGAHESLGSHSPSQSSCTDFSSMIDECELIGIRSQGSRFMWARGHYTRTRVERRLDRAFVSDGCISSWRDISYVALPRRFFDHCPLLIRFSNIDVSCPGPFRFQSMRLDHPDFLPTVHRVWSSPLVGRHFQVVIHKLKCLKKVLKSWNWEVFGDLESDVKMKSTEF